MIHNIPKPNPCVFCNYYCVGLLFRIYYVILGVVISTKSTVTDIFTKLKNIDIEEIPKRSGDVAVITGGAAGIGYEVVKKLLQVNFHVIMGVRNMERGKVTVDRIRSEGINSGKLDYLELDLTSLYSVRMFSERVLAKTTKIHLLINNAGIMTVPFALTRDNMESQFQVNYLSHFLLTNLLLPTIIKTGETSDKCCRIVNTSSSSQLVGNINFDDLQSRKLYSSYKAYFDSKLAQVLSTIYLDRKMVAAAANVRVYSLHPGSVPTGLWDSLGFLVKNTKPITQLVTRTPEKAAGTIIFAALSPEIETRGGIFLVNNKEYFAGCSAEDKVVQQELWKTSLALVGLEDSLTLLN